MERGVAVAIPERAARTRSEQPPTDGGVASKRCTMERGGATSGGGIDARLVVKSSRRVRSFVSSVSRRIR